MAMHVYIGQKGDIDLENSQVSLLQQIKGFIFIFGVCIIPLVMFLSLVVKSDEKILEKFKLENPLDNSKNKNKPS